MDIKVTCPLCNAHYETASLTLGKCPVCRGRGCENLVSPTNSKGNEISRYEYKTERFFGTYHDCLRQAESNPNKAEGWEAVWSDITDVPGKNSDQISVLVVFRRDLTRRSQYGQIKFD